MFKENDIKHLKARGISLEQAQKQMKYFQTGFPVLDITRPAIINDGIKRLDADELNKYQQGYDAERIDLKIVKFVPASGAATRMFKSLFEFLDSKKLNRDTEEVLLKINSFAFYGELKEKLKQEGISVEDSENPEVRLEIIDKVINSSGLNYGSLPKGLLKFHLYDDYARTAFEEHLVEGVLYASGKYDMVNIHFTVSNEHREGFVHLFESVKKEYEQKYKVIFNVGFSEQKPSTDTIAADENNQPFRDKDGNLLFRPGGHGALLNNLNDIDADLIFIKNIDNVVPDSLKDSTVKYKKALAGLILELHNRIKHYASMPDEANPEQIDEAASFISENLGYHFPGNFNTNKENKLKAVKDILNRPLRICGMVKNQGEPGGGPFWVRNPDGSESLQILESSQFDLTIPEHKAAFEKSSHFNPVDLVCITKDKAGKSYNLHDFRNPQTGFISIKSKDGKELKALELPGLWNGSMAFWNTIFVEVPVETFNPVKTINDLLRPQHVG